MPKFLCLGLNNVNFLPRSHANLPAETPPGSLPPSLPPSLPRPAHPLYFRFLIVSFPSASVETDANDRLREIKALPLEFAYCDAFLRNGRPIKSADYNHLGELQESEMEAEIYFKSKGNENVYRRRLTVLTMQFTADLNRSPDLGAGSCFHEDSWQRRMFWQHSAPGGRLNNEAPSVNMR